MKFKYTVIYTNRWQSGYYALTRMKRVEIECDDTNRLDKLAHEVGTKDIQFIFDGWPLMVGENDITAIPGPTEPRESVSTRLRPAFFKINSTITNA
jgi:hypothetical protein